MPRLDAERERRSGAERDQEAPPNLHAAQRDALVGIGGLHGAERRLGIGGIAASIHGIGVERDVRDDDESRRLFRRLARGDPLEQQVEFEQAALRVVACGDELLAKEHGRVGR